MSAARSPAKLTADEFDRARGSRFRATATAAPDEGADPPSFEATLAQVTEYPRGAGGEFRTPFSIVLHGPLQPVMPQGTYRLEHDAIGTIELFLVPIGPDIPSEPSHAPTAMQYEAVFG